MKKTIGILGGMGPLATCDLFHKVVEVTEAGTDQEHIRVCVDSNTEIPDRTAAILSGGADPVPEMVRSALRLECMGADVLIMPCNTAHYFYDQVTRFVRTPFLHMIEETAKEADRLGIRKAGLLATDGTCRSGVYGKAFRKYGVELISPSEEGQKHVMDVIYKGIKAGDLTISLDGFNGAMDELEGKGAEVLILGCTELPVAFEQFQISRPNLDPTRILAAAAVRFVGGKVKEPGTR